MAWSTPTTVNKLFYATEATVTLPSSAVIGYGSEIDFLGFCLQSNHSGYIEVGMEPTAVSGSNLDIALYGAYATSGTKYLLLDAIVADLTVDATRVLGSVNLKAYPMPYYYIAWTADANESANTIDIFITAVAPSNF